MIDNDDGGDDFLNGDTINVTDNNDNEKNTMPLSSSSSSLFYQHVFFNLFISLRRHKKQ